MAVAGFLRLLMDPLLGDSTPYPTFIVAVLITAAYAGVGPAFLCLVLSAATVVYAFLPPRFSLTVPSNDLLGLGLFAATSGIGILLIERLRVRYQRATVEQMRQHGDVQRALEERQREEAELRQRQEWLRVTFSSIGDAVLTADTAGLVTYVNPVAEALTGWNQRDAQGQHIDAVLNIVNERTRIRTENPVTRALRDGAITGLANHTTLIARDGTEHAIDDSAAPIRDEHGEISGVVLIFRDISARRRAERVQQYLAALVESSDDAIYGKTSEGIFTSWNAGAEHLYGYSANEVIGKSVSLLIPDERQAELAAIMSRINRGEKVDLFETTRRRKDGSLVDVSVTVSPIYDRDGVVIGASAIARDITRYRQVEQALVDADRRKDAFLATLAHELRNPLAPMRSCVELLRLAGGNLDVIGNAREMLERQLAQMVRLVDDLLDIARITRGTIDLRREVVDLRTVVENAVETSRPLIEAGGHQLTVTLPDDPLPLYGDPTRLSQVFANLLNNAARFSEQGGQITITAEREGSDTVFIVRDRGIGIEPSAIPRLFEMFSQVDQSPDRRQSGLGIGLSLVRGLVDMHGGRIEARSEGTGRGSEFVVRLPSQRAPAELVPKQPPRREVARVRRRVMVVDDNRDSADSLALVLNLMGHTVRTAYDGEALAEATREFHPDVILLDIGMPGRDGYDVARDLRAQSWGRDVVLIAVTGWGQDSDKQRALDSGFNLHVTKPVEPDALEQLLAGLKGGS